MTHPMIHPTGPGTRRQPVIVLGTARSGTSWCANLLATHPDIAAVATAEHEDITGIHESHLFSHTRYCFPAELDAGAFVERYRQEDYFKLSGLTPQGFAGRHPGRHGVTDLFRMLMEDLAEAKGASHWLEKTPKHTIYYDEVLRAYPDALVVLTRRRFRDTILSNINKYPRKGATFPRQVVEKVFRWVSDRRAIGRFKKACPGRYVEIGYEDLLGDTQGEIARVLSFLGVTERELTSIYPNNSAYQAGRAPGRQLSAIGWLGVYAAAAVFWVVPYPVLRTMRVRRDRQRAERRFPKYAFVPAPSEWSEA